MKASIYLALIWCLTAVSTIAGAELYESVSGDWLSRSPLLGSGYLKIDRIAEDHIVVKLCDKDVYELSGAKTCFINKQTVFEYRDEIDGYCSLATSNLEHYCELSIRPKLDEILLTQFPSAIGRVPYGVFRPGDITTLGAKKVESEMEELPSIDDGTVERGFAYSNYTSFLTPKAQDFVGHWALMGRGLSLLSDLSEKPAFTRYRVRAYNSKVILVESIEGDGLGSGKVDQFIYEPKIDGLCSLPEPSIRKLNDYCVRSLKLVRRGDAVFLQEAWHPSEVVSRWSLLHRWGHQPVALVAYKLVD